MFKRLSTLRRRGTDVPLRRSAAVACVAVALVLTLLSFTRTLAAQDATLTSWTVAAADVYVDGSGDAWYGDNPRTSIVRLEPASTSTVTTWSIPAGGTYRDRTISVDTSTQTAYFAEFINRPNLFSFAIGSVDAATNDFTEWPLPAWPTNGNIHTLARDTAGNVWAVGDSACCGYDATVARLTPADNSVTQWTVPLADFNWAGDVLPMQDGTVFFTINNPGPVARLDPDTGNVTLWTLGFIPAIALGSRSLHADAAGDIWMFAGDRVVRLNTTTNVLTTWSMSGIAVLTALELDGEGRPVFGGVVSAAAPVNGVGRLEVSTGLPTMWPFTSSGDPGRCA